MFRTKGLLTSKSVLSTGNISKILRVILDFTGERGIYAYMFRKRDCLQVKRVRSTGNGLQKYRNLLTLQRA